MPRISQMTVLMNVIVEYEHASAEATVAAVYKERSNQEIEQHRQIDSEKWSQERLQLIAETTFVVDPVCLALSQGADIPNEYRNSSPFVLAVHCVEK